MAYPDVLSEVNVSTVTRPLPLTAGHLRLQQMANAEAARTELFKIRTQSRVPTDLLGGLFAYIYF